MMRLHRGMSSALLVVAAACASAEGTTIVSLDKVPVVEFGNLFEMVDSVMLVTPAEEDIGIASAVLPVGDEMLVTDVTRGNIKVFSKRGALLRTIGQPGDGPGEFRRPISIVRNGQGRLAVLDLMRNVVSIRDSTGALLEERVVPGPWDNVAALPGSDNVLLIGARVRKGHEAGVAGEQMTLHEVDAAGAVTASFHSFHWPSDPYQATFSHFFAVAVGDRLVTGAYASNRVYLIDRRTGAETSAQIGGPWYRTPTWSKMPPASAKNPVDFWARQQVLMTRLYAVDGGRFLAQFRSYTAEGEEQYQYVLADTAGTSLVSTLPTRLRILTVVGETAYGTLTTADGDVALETLKLTTPARQ